ncbi:MAG: caspase family protein [Pseudonocardiaceae bacterium]
MAVENASHSAELIGTWSYDHLKPVAAAEHSLHRMRTLLMSPLCGSWPESQVEVVGDRETLGNLRHELVTWFSSATDVALFYYVGHGQYDNDDRLCLALTDSSREAILRTTSSLTFDDVRHAFRASKATTKIAILDCCFAGLAPGRNNALAGPRDLPRSSGFYLMMASGEFSTAWFQPATESPRPQTFFTKYLVDVIERGIPEQPRGLTLGPIFDQVADRLVRDGKPEPGCRVSDHAAHFVFARNTIAASTKPRRPHPPAPVSPLPTLTDTIELVRVSDPSSPTVTINSRWHIVTDIAFSPDGRLLAIASTT